MFKIILKFLVAVIVAGLVIHFTIKDMFYWSSMVFYAIPLPVISVLALVTSFFSKKLLRGILLIIALVCSVIWVNRSYKQNETGNIDGFEIVFWNARHEKRFQDALTENSRVPDVLVMVEYDNEKVNYSKNKHPEYYYFLSDSTSIGIFSKTPITVYNEIIHEENSTVLNFETNGLNFYAIDISASYLNYRKESLQFATSNIHKKEKTIILGDFNTPFESRHFTFFKNNFTHAFNKKGNGFRETWFWNIPLLSLDHIWVSKDLKILKAEKMNTWKSDHSMIKTTVRN